MFSEAQKTIIAQRSRLSLTEEICGFVMRRVRRGGNEGVLQLRNIAPDRVNAFEIKETAVARAITSGKLRAVWHSHPLDSQAAVLSPADIAASKARGIPYLLYHPVFDQWDYFDPISAHPYPFDALPDDQMTSLAYYLGWRFVWDRCDCWSLVRGYFKGILGVVLLDFPRGGTGPECVGDESWNEIQDNIAVAGFRKLHVDEPLQNGDLAVMALSGANPHHFVILHDAAAGVGLHILENQVSATVQYRESMKRATRFVLRHETQESQ